MTNLYPVKKTEQNVGPLADSRNFLSDFSVDSISPLVSHDYFPELKAPVTLPCNCICNSRGPGRIKTRSVLSPALSKDKRK